MGHCNDSDCKDNNCDSKKEKKPSIKERFQEHIKHIRWMYYNRGLKYACWYAVGLVPISYVRDILEGVNKIENKFRKTDAERNEYKAKFLRFEDESKELNKIIEEKNYLKMELDSKTFVEKELGKEMDKIRIELRWIKEKPEYLELVEKWRQEDKEANAEENAKKLKESEERVSQAASKVEKLDKKEERKKRTLAAKKAREKRKEQQVQKEQKK